MELEIGLIAFLLENQYELKLIFDYQTIIYNVTFTLISFTQVPLILCFILLTSCFKSNPLYFR